MSDDDRTGNESPLAKHVATLVAREIRSILAAELEGPLQALELRVVAGVIRGLSSWRMETDQRVERVSHRLDTYEDALAGLAQKVHALTDFARTLGYSEWLDERANRDTERPPDTERP
jgi:hypothetical protein